MSSIAGLVACSLVVVGLVQTMLGARRRSFKVRLAFASGLFALMFVPVGGLPICGYVRGLIGDPSMTMVVIAAIAIAAQTFGRDPFADRELRPGMLLIVATATILYPATLGLTPVDPYALGYGSLVLWAAVLGLTLAAWFFDQHFVLLCTTLGVLAFLAGLYESPNLWDYLMDPAAVVTAVVWLVGDRIKAFAAGRSDRPSSPSARPEVSP